MIQFDKEKDFEADAPWLNRQIKEHLHEQSFTPTQEAALKALIHSIAGGYRHTISRQNWGIGWD